VSIVYRVDRYMDNVTRLPRAHRYKGVNAAAAAAVRFFERREGAAVVVWVEDTERDIAEPATIVYVEAPGKVQLDHSITEDGLSPLPAVTATQDRLTNSFRCGVRASRHGTEWSTR
jgi:hypothetical protein